MQLGLLQRTLRDAVLLHLGVREAGPERSRQKLRRVASKWSLRQLIKGCEWVVETLDGLETDRNWNVMLSLEHLFLRLHQLRKEGA